MSIQYHCEDDRRRQAVLAHPTLNGIDYLEVLDHDYFEILPGLSTDRINELRQRTLLIHCLKTIDLTLSENNVEIEGGVRVQNISVRWAARANDTGRLKELLEDDEETGFLDYLNGLSNPAQLLVVRTNARGDFSAYRLSLVSSSTNPEPPDDFDTLLSSVEFSFKVECPSDFDCAVEQECPTEFEKPPVIDYLSRDYASFRQLMLDRISTVAPDWQVDNPADFGMAVVELLAYAGDYLSYFQDAVATEAYLGTARQRVSMRRHARLLDYRMHEGCNAKAWVHLQVVGGVAGLSIPAGTPLLTTANESETRIDPDSSELEQAVASGSLVFETRHKVSLYHEHNEIEFHTWAREQCCLPKGAMRAALKDHLEHLNEGDVLVFEEILGVNGNANDANPLHRHAVRLIRVTLTEDEAVGQLDASPSDDAVPVTEIEWSAEDALPFPLCISTEVDGELIEGISVARGNIVLADHGQTIQASLDEVPEGQIYRPQLEDPDLTYRVPDGDEDDDQIISARASVMQDPRQALPDMTLTTGGESWTPQYDLLNTDRFTPEFVVEMANDRTAFLRFGDNMRGKEPSPGTNFDATYRIGNGTAGNVGSEAIAHMVTSDTGIVAVGNPLPGQGGIDPEAMEDVRQFTPQAFRTQERAVTEADYAEVAERHDEVQKAVATRRWTGSWYTMFITVDRLGGLEIDAEFEAELRQFLDRFRMAGHDLEVDAPRFVPLEIVMTVCVKPDYFRSDVEEALLETFSNTDLSDGRRGFFHPDNVTFGDPVYLSKLIAEAMKTPGVRWVDMDDSSDKPNRFRRWGEPARDEIDEGLIEVDRLEITRLDNEPSAPENGRIEFRMEGGL